jgi:glycosyltransferase involved in cell wall biosynthesis
MRVALIHNHYQQSGGEDAVYAAEGALLESHGHKVVRHTVHNDAVANMSKVRLAGATVWNRHAYHNLRALFHEERPDVVHVHNTLPLISPAALAAARAEGAAVVQTLHNYRQICPSGLLFREGAPCHMCVGRAVPWPGVVHSCYRGSRSATSVVAAMLVYHRALGTFRHSVDRFIALTGFARDRFIEGGMSAEKIMVKPNFIVDDPGVGTGSGGYALFVGRLSEEKGLRVLLDAWRRVGARLPLRIVGDGPMAEVVSCLAASMPAVTVVGQLPPARVFEEMRAATVAVVPSICYETFGLVAMEALAVGTPVMASQLGAMCEFIEHGANGLFFTAGDSSALASAALWIAANPERVRAMRTAARLEYARKYAPEVNYRLLMDVYAQALASRPRARG